MILTEPLPFDEATKHLDDKVVMPTGLDTAGLSQLPAALRRRTFFSAKVLTPQIVQDFKNSVGEIMKGQSDVATQRWKLKDALDAIGYHPDFGKEGGLQDLGSNRRLMVMLQTNASMIRGFGQYVQGNTEGALAAYPALELIRVEERMVPRDWFAIWDEAADELGDATTATSAEETGRMVAVKGDPIWLAISDFGQPYAPFKWGSGMGQEGVDRDDAIDLGVVDENDPPPSPESLDLNEGVLASIADLDPEIAAVLEKSLEGVAKVVGSTIQMIAGQPGSMPNTAELRRRADEAIFLMNAMDEPRDPSTGRWVGEFRVNVHPSVFRALGIKPGNVFANGAALQKKHPENFQDPQEAREHVERVFARPTHILPGNRPDHRLIVRTESGGDHSAAILEVELKGGKYRVRSAYRMPESQLAMKIVKSAGQVVRLGNSRVDRLFSETPSRRLSGPRGTPPVDFDFQLMPSAELRQRANAFAGLLNEFNPEEPRDAKGRWMTGAEIGRKYGIKKWTRLSPFDMPQLLEEGGYKVEPRETYVGPRGHLLYKEYPEEKGNGLHFYKLTAPDGQKITRDFLQVQEWLLGRRNVL